MPNGEFISNFKGSQIESAVSYILTGKENLNKLPEVIKQIETQKNHVNELYDKRVPKIEGTLNTLLSVDGAEKKTLYTDNIIFTDGRGKIHLTNGDNTERNGCYLNSTKDIENSSIMLFHGVDYVPVYSQIWEDEVYSVGIFGAKGNPRAIWCYNTTELAQLTHDGLWLVYGGNDFAEFRNSNETEAGRVVCENGDGTLSRSYTRLQPGAVIVSDTYGSAIGQGHGNIPVAVAGRVLAYPYEDWWTFEPGEAVCAGPNGTVSKMSRREIRKYPERIIGTVSELPTYEKWKDISVNGRIWITIK